MPPPRHPSSSPRNHYSLFLALGLFAVLLLLFIYVSLRTRRIARHRSPETEPLLSQFQPPPLGMQEMPQLPPPVSGALLLNSSVREPSEGRRHSYPLSGSGIAAEKVRLTKAGEKAGSPTPVLDAFKFGPATQLLLGKECEPVQRVQQKRETIEIFGATQDDVPGKKATWRRRTLEFQ